MNDFKLIFEKLNDDQRKAVLDDSDACLVNANVGSGKTTVLTMKAQYLCEQKDVDYADMVILTFTNKASDEIKDRLGIVSGDSSFYHVGTFHSVAMYMLAKELDVTSLGYTAEFEIIDPDQELALCQELIEQYKLNIKYKNRLAKRLQNEKVPKYGDDLPRLRDLLAKEKISRNKMSYDDLIDHALSLIKQLDHTDTGMFKFPKWVIVDEVQDCDARQLDLIDALKSSHTKLFAVGDPSQSIYSFRAGNLNVFYQLQHRYEATLLSLPINYRSNASILKAAARFKQAGTSLIGSDDTTEKITVKEHYDSFQESVYLAGRIQSLHDEGVLYGDIAIFYRMQDQAVMLSKALAMNNIPYDIKGNKKSWEIPSLKQMVESSENTSADDEDHVHLMTLHASKGLEFTYVFIIGVNNGLIPMSASKAVMDDEEEMRLFFVGITRAKAHLELSYYTSPDRHGVFPMESRFLRMIPAELLDWEGHRQAPAASVKELKQMIIEQRNGHVEPDQEETEQKDIVDAKKNQIIESGSEENGLRELDSQEKREETVGEAVRIEHPKYGCGRVISDNGFMVTVEFDDFGTKEFVKSMLGL